MKWSVFTPSPRAVRRQGTNKSTVTLWGTGEGLVYGQGYQLVYSLRRQCILKKSLARFWIIMRDHMRVCFASPSDYYDEEIMKLGADGGSGRSKQNCI